MNYHLSCPPADPISKSSISITAEPCLPSRTRGRSPARSGRRTLLCEQRQPRSRGSPAGLGRARSLPGLIHTTLGFSASFGAGLARAGVSQSSQNHGRDPSAPRAPTAGPAQTAQQCQPGQPWELLELSTGLGLPPPQD